MADKEMIAATLAAAALSPIDFSRSTDQKALVAHEAAIAVNVYEAILAELEKRQASGSPTGP
jgi:hypothetical protein